MTPGPGPGGSRDITPEVWMQRCLELAQLGAGHVAPNPMVGAVLVHNGIIIGEGYHQQYGHAHAEVNCIASVKKENESLIPQSTIYVSLEPCAHYGKTPPCADLIIKNKIPRVVIGCRDPFEQVDGKGIEKLEKAGIEVVTGVLEKECRELNRRFFTWHTLQRPYIILKWAQTANDMIAAAGKERLLISNEYTNRLVHRWRSEEAGILVGTNTALLDDPELTTRLWNGPSPVRMVIDMNLRLPSSLKLFNEKSRTIVFNSIKQEENGVARYYRLTKNESLVPQIIKAIHALNVQSVIVEGGARLLQSFIDAKMWDEIRRITNTLLIVPGGIAAPVVTEAIKINESEWQEDRVEVFRPAGHTQG